MGTWCEQLDRSPTEALPNVRFTMKADICSALALIRCALGRPSPKGNFAEC